MRIERIDGGFVHTIENGVVEKVVGMFDGTCTVHFYGKSPKKLRVGCSVYNSQYGLPVSEDGSKLFISSWEDGLFAYDISSGAVLWRLKGARMTAILVYPEYVVTKKYGNSIIKLDIITGEVLAEIKNRTIERQFDLISPYILVHSIKGKLSVVDTDKMLVTKKYNPEIVNPSNSLSVLIQDATLRGNTLTISGVERENYCATLPLYNQKAFNRVIDADFYAS